MPRSKRLFSFLERLAVKRNLIILFAVTALFPFVIFPLSGVDVSRIPDARFFYSPHQLIELLQSYTATERAAYYLGAFLIDLLYPLAYSLLLAALLTNLLRKRVGSTSQWYRLRLLPFAAALIDLLENFALAALLSGIDQPLYGLAVVASLLTLLKWVLVFISILLILVLFMIELMTRLRTEH